MIFSEAFDRLKGGERIRMMEWSPGNFLLIRIVDGKPLAELYVDGGTTRLTWSPTQRELFSSDWQIAPKPEPQVTKIQGVDAFKSGN